MYSNTSILINTHYTLTPNLNNFKMLCTYGYMFIHSFTKRIQLHGCRNGYKFTQEKSDLTPKPNANPYISVHNELEKIIFNPWNALKWLWYVKVCLTTPHSKGLCVDILLIAFTVLVVGSTLFYKTHYKWYFI